MNDENVSNFLNLAALSNEELEALYQKYENNSAESILIRKEMIERGYTFSDTQKATQAEPINDLESHVAHHYPASTQSNTAFGGGLWDILYALFGIIAVVLLLTRGGDGPKSAVTILSAIAVGIGIASFGGLVSGIKLLAYKKEHPHGASNTGSWQTILGIGWILIILGEAIIIVKLITAGGQFGYHPELGELIPILMIPLAILLISISMATSLISLGKSISS